VMRVEPICGSSGRGPRGWAAWERCGSPWVWRGYDVRLKLGEHVTGILVLTPESGGLASSRPLAPVKSFEAMAVRAASTLAMYWIHGHRRGRPARFAASEVATLWRVLTADLAVRDEGDPADAGVDGVTDDGGAAAILLGFVFGRRGRAFGLAGGEDGPGASGRRWLSKPCIRFASSGMKRARISRARATAGG